MSTFLLVLAAVSPPAVAVALAPARRPLVLAAGAAVAWVVAVAVAAASEPILDALDVSRPTFRVATGVVLGLTSARLLILAGRVERFDGPADRWRDLVVPVLVPVLLTPQLLVVAVSAGADHGVLAVAVGAAISLALATAAASVPFSASDVVWTAGTRLVAALGIAMSIALAVDGVQTI